MQLALSSCITYLLSIKSWSLHDMLFCRQTGSIVWTRFNPNYDQARALLCAARTLNAAAQPRLTLLSLWHERLSATC